MDYYNYAQNMTQHTPWAAGYQPVPAMMQPIQASEDKLVWVRGGEQAVASYPQAPGRTGYYTDFDEPILVKKVTNNNGQTAELKVFDLVERGAEPPKDTPQYVTNEDFLSYKAQMMDLAAAVEELKVKFNTQYHHHNKKGQNNHA